jgi:class 3 adenylate cyclase
MENLIIIDHNRKGFSDIRDRLKSETNFNLFYVENLEESIKISNENPPDCILFMLDGLTKGTIDDYKHIKHHKNTKMTPVIILGESINRQTGRIIDILLVSGLYDVLINPGFEGLIRKIKKAIDYKNSYNRAKIFENYYLSMFKTNRNLCFVLTRDLNIRLFNNSAMKRFKINRKNLGNPFVNVFPKKKIRLSLNEILTNPRYINKKEFSFKTYTTLNSTDSEPTMIRWRVATITDELGSTVSFILIGEEECSTKAPQDKTSSEVKSKTNQDVTTLDKEVEQLRDELAKEKKKSHDCDKTKQELKAELETTKDLLKKVQEERDILKTEVEKNNNNMDTLHSEIEKSNYEIEMMESLKQKLEKYELNNEPVIEILNKEIEKTKKQNERLGKVLRQYTSKATWKYLLRRIMENKNKIAESFIMEDFGTMLFGDIQGFTKFAERYKPEDVLKSLNQMFNLVTDIVYEFNGDIDKFMGDAFFAYFSQPLDAIKAAVKIAKKVDEVNDERMMTGLTPLFFRFGINSGKAVRGDIGSNKRRENTLIGDSVNIAQRLESSSIPGQILISEATYQSIKEYIIVSEKVELKLKGRKSTIIAYYVEGLVDNDIQEEQETA